jgi:hypothetical protein
MYRLDNVLCSITDILLNIPEFVDPNSWIEDSDFARDGLHLNGRGKKRLGHLYARVSGLGVESAPGSRKRLQLENETPVSSNRASSKAEVGLSISSASETSAYRIKGKLLVVLQVNCRSIYNKALEFWNLVDTYNPDVVIGTESWLKEDIGSAEVFRADFTTFRRDRAARGGGVFICVKTPLHARSCG